MLKYSKCGRRFTEEEINLIIRIVKEKYNTYRCEISREVCRILNWYSENGKPKDWICRKFLLKLEKDGLIKLPTPMPQSCRFPRLKPWESTTNHRHTLQAYALIIQAPLVLYLCSPGALST